MLSKSATFLDFRISQGSNILPARWKSWCCIHRVFLWIN